MNSGDRHWLDASLEEVLGGQRPPDLSARILASLQAARAGESANPVVSSPVVANLEPVAPPVVAPPVVRAGQSAGSVLAATTSTTGESTTGESAAAESSRSEASGSESCASVPTVTLRPAGANGTRSTSARGGSSRASNGRSTNSRASTARGNGARSSNSASSPTLVAALTLAIVGGMGFLAYILSRDPQAADQLAKTENSSESTVPPAVAGERSRTSSDSRFGQDNRPGQEKGIGRRSTNERDRAVASSKRRSPANSEQGSPTKDSTARDSTATRSMVAQDRGARDATPSVAAPPSSAEGTTDTVAKGSANEPTNLPADAQAPWNDQQLVAWVNHELRAAWDEAGASPAEPATDSEWCRRVFLRVLGRIPTVEEVRAFAADEREDRREQLVGQLLASDSKYADEFASHWADVWTNVLVGRKPDGKPVMASRDQLADHLKRRIAEDQPFDEMMGELLTATGSNVPGAEDYNAAVNFLLAHADEKATGATSRVSRVFLGRHLQCGQCHVDPEGAEQIAQQQFWQLNAFFRQMHVEPLSDQFGARLVNRDFKGDRRGGSEQSDAAVFYESGNGSLRAAYPVFIDGTEGSTSGLLSEVDRRKELAKKIAKSDEFRKTVVNRIWAHYLGFGIVNPVDDLSPHNEPSHPELLEQLASQFAAHHFNLRDISRWIVLSDGFGLSSKGGGGAIADSPELGKRPLFSRYYARPMQVEQLYESLKLLADARRGGNGRETTRTDFLGRVARRIGDERMDDGHAIIEVIPDSLAKVDHELPRRALGGDQASLIEKVARNEKMTSDQKISHLFQAALARTPTAKEAQAARELLKLSPNDSSIGLRDLWWALLNSNEFLLDH